MVKINYAELRFEHIVVFTREDTIFVCGRQTDTDRMRLFLVFGYGEGTVYTRNGRADSWEILEDYEAEIVRQRIRESKTSSTIPIYYLNCTHKAVIAG